MGGIMPDSPSVFSLWHIALTAAIAFGVSLITLLTWGKRQPAFVSRDAVIVALVVGISVLMWRLAANVPQLNDDPVPLFSPNDVLCPIVTYVLLGIYAGFRRPVDLARWAHARALLTIISFAVNVITI
jgi:hypothetical protein